MMSGSNLTDINRLGCSFKAVPTRYLLVEINNSDRFSFTRFKLFYFYIKCLSQALFQEATILMQLNTTGISNSFK